MVKVVARRREGFAHDVEIEGGHTIASTSRARRRHRHGPLPHPPGRRRPRRLHAVTIEMYAERKGWDVGKVEVDVDVEYDGLAPSPSPSPCACRRS